MSRIFLFLSFLTMPLLMSAQSADSVRSAKQVQADVLSIAVYSYEKCFNAIPELEDVKANVQLLHDQYVAELKRAEDDFNAKYEDFLTQQDKLAPSIRNKRQAELQTLMEKNMEFKKQSQKTLADTEAATLKPLKEKLLSVVRTIAKNSGYNMVLNSDNGNVPYIDNVKVTDITEAVIFNLK